MTVFFSSSDLIESWPPENTLEVIGEPEEYITCIGDPLFGNLPLYTNKATRLVTGSVYPDDEDAGNINVRLIHSGVGCLSQKSVKTMNNMQYFLSGGQGGNVPGIYAFNGVSVKEKTKPLRTFFRDSVNISTGIVETSAAFVYRENYCLSVTTITNSPANGVLTVCIDGSDRITTYDNFNFSDSFEFNDKVHLLTNRCALGGAGGQCSEIISGYFRAIHNPSYTNDFDEFPHTDVNEKKPSAIQFAYKTKDFDLGHPNAEKGPERAYVKSSVSTNPVILTVQANYNFGSSSTTWRINLSTYYATVSSNTQTIYKSSDSMVTKLTFPSSLNKLDFNTINFTVSASSAVILDYIDFYALKRPLK